MMTNDTQQPPIPTPPSPAQQGGAFGGQPYDPATDTSSSDDFVLDMDEIPDFSLDDVETTTQQEQPTQQTQPDQSSVSVAPATPTPAPTPEVNDDTTNDISFDLDDLELESMGEVSDDTTDAITTQDVSAPAAPSSESSQSSETPSSTAPTPPQSDDFDLNLDGIIESSDAATQTPATPSPTEQTDTGTTEDDVTIDTFEIEDLKEDSEDTETSDDTSGSNGSQEDIDFDLGSLEENPTSSSDDVADDQQGGEDPVSSLDTTDQADVSDSPVEVEEVSDIPISEETSDTSDAPTSDHEQDQDAVPAVLSIDTDGLSPLGAKAANLIATITHIHALEESDGPIRVLGASHDREEVHYEFSIGDRALEVLRDAADADGHTTQDRLTFELGEDSAVVRLDDVVVLDESSDESIYTKYEHVVSEKMGKFAMLLEEYLMTAEQKKQQSAAMTQIKEAGKKLQAF